MSIEINLSKQGHAFAAKPISTPLGRACNIWLERPKTAEFDKKFPDNKYQIELLVPKANKHMLRAMYEACSDIVAKLTETGGIWHGKVKSMSDVVLPFLDGDLTAAKYPHYAGMYRLHPKRKMEKGMVKVKDAQGQLYPPKEVYAGSWGRAAVTLYSYNGAPMKERRKNPQTGQDEIVMVETYGITMSLEAYQFWKDGDPITFSAKDREPDDSAFNDLPEGETTPPPAKVLKVQPPVVAAPAQAQADDEMPF